MIWVDEKIVSYEKAINSLNFDKNGNETGLGSWGVMISIKDGFKSPLDVFIGIKLDVLSVFTNRFITNFVNIPKKIKDSSAKTKKNSKIDCSVHGVSKFKPDINSENVIEIFVDTHKINIDVVELLNTIYLYSDTTEEYVALARTKVFKSGNRRASRGVSAKMLRIYDGNLENFGFIFTKTRDMFLLNEVIVDIDKVSDEIKYTIWLNPHDREEYEFFMNDGDIPIEEGSNYLSGLGIEKVLGKETKKLYQYDRRGMRTGYYDITVENPAINNRYTDGDLEMSDTFQFENHTLERFHKHKSMVSISSRFREFAGEFISTYLYKGDKQDSESFAKSVFKEEIENDIINIFKKDIKNGVMEYISNYIQENSMKRVIKFFELLSDTEIPEKYISDISYILKETTIVPFVTLNKIHDFKNINVDEIMDCILFIYNPILNKYVFYEIEKNDNIEITKESILFYSDGTKYGIDLRGNDNLFIWSNFEKRFRNTISKWIDLKGKSHYIGETEEEHSNTIENIKSHTDCRIQMYDDLSFKDNCAKLIAINKKDVLDNITKLNGKLNSKYVLGIKTGDIEIEGDGIWM